MQDADAVHAHIDQLLSQDRHGGTVVDAGAPDILPALLHPGAAQAGAEGQDLVLIEVLTGGQHVTADQVAHHEIDAVHFHQALAGLDSLFRNALGVVSNHFQHLAVQAAVGVDLVDGQLLTIDLVLADLSVGAGQGLEGADQQGIAAAGVAAGGVAAGGVAAGGVTAGGVIGGIVPASDQGQAHGENHQNSNKLFHCSSLISSENVIFL